MNRKRLAVVLSQPDSTYQKNLLKGILSEAYKYEFDVCVFSSFIKYGTSDEYRDGESNIYDLINCEKFDGAVVVPDSIKFPGVSEEVLRRFKEKGVPAVTVDLEIEGFPCVWNSDSDDTEKLVDHLIDVHGCRVIDFFSGFKDHPHSLNREAGYIRSLKKHGIPVEPERIHYGDFWTNMTEQVAGEILDSGRELPQGIACACDRSAASLASLLVSRGYRVPEDFRIVGYDATYEETKEEPDITSMMRNSGQAGVRTVRKLYKEIFGEQPPLPEYSIENDIIAAVSCGCERVIEKKELYRCRPESKSIYDDLEGFFSGYNFMLENLISQESYEEFLWKANWYSLYIKDFDGLYFCVCGSCFDLSEDSEENYLRKGYPEQMIEALIRKGDEAKVDPKNTFDTSLMLPELYEERDKPSVFYFSPLHFNDRCFGYTVLHYINKAVVFNPEYSSWMKMVDNAFEALRRRLKLKYLNDRLESFSVTDMLTGIYNRNGYTKFAPDMLKAAGKMNEDLFVLMGDMNNLKQINDRYGHLEGDESLIEVAKAMNSVCREGEKCFRIGGDEFVIIGAGGYSDEGIKERFDRINSFIDAYNCSSGKPYKVSVSLGACCAPAGKFDSIEQALAVADERMFQNKQMLKKTLKNLR